MMLKKAFVALAILLGAASVAYGQSGVPVIPLMAGKTVTAANPLAVTCISGCSGGGGGGGAVFGPTAAGSAAANPPVLMGGTVDGTATGAVDNVKVASGSLFVNCSNCSGSGVSETDQGAFTAGSSLFAAGGGFFQTTATTNPLTTGQFGLFQVTSTRALFTNLRNAAGTEIGTSSNPVQVSVANTGANATAMLVTGTGGTFPVSQATAASLNATVVGTGTFAVQATLQASSATAIGTVNPTTIGNWGLAASTQNGTTPTNGQLVMAQFNTTPTTITSGNISPLQLDNAGNLLVNIKAGAGSGGTALADEAAFTQGTTSLTPIGGIYVTSVTNLTAGQAGAVRLTNDRKMMVDTPNVEVVVGGAAAPTDALVGGAVYNSSPITVTATNAAALQSDVNGYLKVNVQSAVGLAQGSTTSGQTGSMIMGAVTTAPPSYTTAQTSPLSLDTSGNTRVVVYPGAAGAAGYPNGATPLTASATGTTGATTATLAGTGSKTTYLCSYSIRANATVATTVTNTVTGVISATMSHIMWVAPAASGIGVDEQIFNPCIPASGTNQAIAVVSGAPGAGGTVSSTATGYQL